MAVEIHCPECSAVFSVEDAFPGSRISCSNCQAILVLDIEKQRLSKKSIVPPVPGPKIHKPSDKKDLIRAAISHLSSWLDISENKISEALDRLVAKEGYEDWKIPKGTSPYSFREISAPIGVLKEVQRRILDRLLYRIPVSNAAHGFITGRSIVTNASYHLNTAQSILNVDLKDAFPSVKKERVKHLLVRYIKIPLKHLGEQIDHGVLNEVVSILVELITHNGGLPQGGPCSGYMLNVACITLDKYIYRLLQTQSNRVNQYRYTRYADDMTISSNGPINSYLQKEITRIILNSGYLVNPKKVHYAEKANGQKLEVTGLIIEKNKVRIPPSRLDAFRANIHQASLITTEDLTPEKKLEIQSVIAFAKMVYGKIPHRLWGPYNNYLTKHGLPHPIARKSLQWDQYPT